MTNRKIKYSLKQNDLFKLFVSISVVCLVSLVLSLDFFRLDLTSEKRFSLSQSTKNILSKIDKPLYLEVYLAGELPVGFKNLQNSLLELVDEYSVYSGSKINFMLIDPSQEPNEAKRNKMYESLQKRGLMATSLQHKKLDGSVIQKIIFPSLIIHNRKREIAVNLLKNNSSIPADENLNKSIEALEYELTKAISKLIVNKQKTVAFLKGHQELDMYSLASINSRISKDYNVVQLDTEKLKDVYADISTLIIAQARTNFSERDKYIIDQYIMNGGSVLWLIDEVECSLESLRTQSSTTALYKPINIDDQLFIYGLRINADLIMDVQCLLIPIQTSLPGQAKKFSPSPWYFSPLLQANNNHAISNNISLVKGEFANSIDFVGSNDGIKKTVLLSSSKYTSLKKVPMQVSLDIAREKFSAADFSSGSRVVSVLLEGEFKSIFNNRINKNIDRKHFVSKCDSSKIIVISDGDIIKNSFSGSGANVKIHDLAYDRYSRQTYGNADFLMNCISYLSGDSELMNLRSRKIKMRMLNKTIARDNRSLIQFINIIVPLFAIFIFALVFIFYRRRKYIINK